MKIYKSSELLDKFIPSEQLNRYLDLVEAANKKFNLHSRSISREELKSLIAESVIPAELGWITDDAGPILDIGSGWGLPVIPLLIANNDLDYTLVERSQKKSDFLTLVISQLGLKANVYNKDMAQLDIENHYSTVTMRRVALDKKLAREIKSISKSDSNLIFFGDKLSVDFFESHQVVDYSLDNSPVRKIIKAKIY